MVTDFENIFSSLKDLNCKVMYPYGINIFDYSFRKYRFQNIALIFRRNIYNEVIKDL